MGKLMTPQKIINKIIRLREKGHTVSEISLSINKSKSVVSKYIQNVDVIFKYKEVLKRKQGGSKVRSEESWNEAKSFASKILGKISKRDKMILLMGIYWGEGTKKELNVINSDPILLFAFINFIEQFGVSKDRIRASIRIYDNIDYMKALSFWSNILKLNKNSFYKPEIVKGNKKSKFKFGMCRIRVEKSSREFKLLISLINNAKEQIMLL